MREGVLLPQGVVRPHPAGSYRRRLRERSREAARRRPRLLQRRTIPRQETLVVQSVQIGDGPRLMNTRRPPSFVLLLRSGVGVRRVGEIPGPETGRGWEPADDTRRRTSFRKVHRMPGSRALAFKAVSEEEDARLQRLRPLRQVGGAARPQLVQLRHRAEELVVDCEDSPPGSGRRTWPTRSRRCWRFRGAVLRKSSFPWSLLSEFRKIR